MSERGGCLGTIISIAVIGCLGYLFVLYVLPLVIKAAVIVVVAVAAIGAAIGGGVALWAYLSSLWHNLLEGKVPD